MKNGRRCERLIIEANKAELRFTKVRGYWVKTTFCKLKIGDIFRPIDDPNRVAVVVAMENDSKQSVYAMPVNGFLTLR